MPRGNFCLAAMKSLYWSSGQENCKHQRFRSEVGKVFGEIGGELPAKFGRRFSSFFCWGKSSEAFSTKTPPQISPSNFTTRFWVVAGPRFSSTLDPDTFEKYRDTSPLSIAILSQKYALLLAESSIYTTNLYHDTGPICIAILLQKY